jgi:threonine aldolase
MCFGDDPTVNALQERIAGLLGFEAALFVPTGTQSNLCAILAHCQRGDEYLVGQMAHCYRWEGGGAAVLGSVQPQPIAHQADGTLALADIEAAIKPDDAHFARTRLLALENTLGGSLLPFDVCASRHRARIQPRAGPPSGRGAAVQRGGGAGGAHEVQCRARGASRRRVL